MCEDTGYGSPQLVACLSILRMSENCATCRNAHDSLFPLFTACAGNEFLYGLNRFYLSGMFLTTNRLITALFALLFVGAAVFSMERVLFADASFILFRIINTGTMQIQEHRYGSFITQSLPLIAAYLHLPLKVIVVVYSVSFPLFYLTVVLLLLYHFKENELAVLMSFYFLLFVGDTWFWMNNEVHQGIAWMFLFFATTNALGRRKVNWLITVPVSTALAFLTLFTHPLLLFPTSYLWLFFTGRKNWPFSRRQTVLFTVILIAFVLAKLYLSNSASSHYDAEKLQGIRQFSFYNISHAFRTPFVQELLHHMFWNYWIVPLLFISGIRVSLKKKDGRLIVLTAGFAALYFAALCLTFSDFAPFYTESELMPATVILTTPFVYYVLPQVTKRNRLILLAIIFLIRLGYIGFASPKWIERKEWLFNTLKEMRRQQINKALLYLDEKDRKQLLLHWGTPVESIIASALSGDQPQRTFVVGNSEELKERIPPDNQTMISSFEWQNTASLNPRYFSFDTAQSYQVLKTE